MPENARPFVRVSGSHFSIAFSPRRPQRTSQLLPQQVTEGVAVPGVVIVDPHRVGLPVRLAVHAAVDLDHECPTVAQHDEVGPARW